MKSILISEEINEKLKKYSKTSGMKIRSITEKAIVSIIDKAEKKEENNV